MSVTLRNCLASCWSMSVNWLQGVRLSSLLLINSYRESQKKLQKCGFNPKFGPYKLSCVFPPTSELYNLCQMFPVAACKAMQSVLKDSADSMEQAMELKGRAAFPTLDMVRVSFSSTFFLGFFE